MKDKTKSDSIASRSPVFPCAPRGKGFDFDLFQTATRRPHYNNLAMISEDLLAALVCPECRKPVVRTANSQGLKCGQCRRVYPIQDEIPIMLIDAATIDPA